MINTVKDRTKLREAFHEIFDSYDPFDPLNTDRFPFRAVIYPTDDFYLTELQLNALIKTLDEIKESRIFISDVESRPYDPFTKGDHWILSDFDYEEYRSISIPVEDAIYSDSGRWGLLLSHEQHALLVCDNIFGEIYQSYYQSLKKDLTAFIEFWDEVKSKGVEATWLPKLLDTLTISKL